MRLERQWQDAGFPKLSTEAGDWFHTQITAAETAYVTATGIYDNTPDPDGGIAAGLSRTRQQKTRSRVRTRFKIGLPFRTRGSQKATAPVHRMHSSARVYSHVFQLTLAYATRMLTQQPPHAVKALASNLFTLPPLPWVFASDFQSCFSESVW